MTPYDFHCATCGIVFEIHRPMAEYNAPATCPECRSTETKRVYMPINFFVRSTSREYNPPEKSDKWQSIEDYRVKMKGIRIENNAGVGMKVNKHHLVGSDIVFRNNAGGAIEANDSILDFDDLDIS